MDDLIDRLAEEATCSLVKQWDRTAYDEDKAVVAAAMRRYAMTPPVPSTVSEERLVEIESYGYGHPLGKATAAEMEPSSYHSVIRDHRNHILHLTHLVQCMSRESEGEVFAAAYDLGRRSGAKEQREADVRRLDPTLLFSEGERGVAREVAEVVIGRLRDHVLVTDPKEAKQ